MQEANRTLLGNQLRQSMGMGTKPLVDGDAVLKLALDFFEFVSADDEPDDGGGEDGTTPQDSPVPGAQIGQTDDSPIPS